MQIYKLKTVTCPNPKVIYSETICDEEGRHLAAGFTVTVVYLTTEYQSFVMCSYVDRYHVRSLLDVEWQATEIGCLIIVHRPG